MDNDIDERDDEVSSFTRYRRHLINDEQWEFLIKAKDYGAVMAFWAFSWMASILLYFAGGLWLWDNVGCTLSKFWGAILMLACIFGGIIWAVFLAFFLGAICWNYLWKRDLV